ncbi:MAG: ISNCY family transposase [Chloroflexota bacterium]
MSQQGKREVVERLRHRYLQASRSEKTKILDEFVALSGLHRKSAIRALRQGYQSGAERRGRKRMYTGAVVSALVKIWRVCGCICGKRLQPFLPEMVAVLERHDELVLDEETRRLLLQMSAATIDRKLQPYRQQQGRGLSTTKPGTLLKQSIPVRTFAEWDDVQPGFLEMDLVAHCGDTVEGQYLNTLTATDIATGWTECLLLRQRSQLAVTAAMDCLRQRLPFPLRGLDSDNDSVFINGTLKRYCEGNAVTFTRSRPWKKNDQAWVEQKNGAVVRGTIGYRRYTSPEAAQLLEAIHEDLHAYVNFFQPVQKLVEKHRDGAKIYKRYDVAQTPHQRAMASPAVSPICKVRLQRQYRQLNPAQLRRQIDDNLRRLRQLPE